MDGDVICPDAADSPQAIPLSAPCPHVYIFDSIGLDDSLCSSPLTNLFSPVFYAYIGFLDALYLESILF
jgi:hypothetical protein